MNRQEFMRILSEKLDCLPLEEKSSAINYYQEFFEDAGIESEQSVISSLGSPEFLAENIIKSSGCFIETNSETTYRPNFQNDNSQHTNKNNFNNAKFTNNTSFTHTKPRRNNKLFKLLLIIVLIATSPAWIGILFGLLGVVIGLLAACFVIIAAFFAIPIATISAGVYLIPSSPIGAIFAFGLTAIFIGIFILLIPVIKWIFKGIRHFFMGIGQFIKNIFLNRR